MKEDQHRLSKKFDTKLKESDYNTLKEMADYEGRTLCAMGRLLILAGLQTFKQSQAIIKNEKS